MPRALEDLDKNASNAFDNSSFLGAILSPINPLSRSNSESHQQGSRHVGRMSNTRQKEAECETTKRLYSSKDTMQRCQFNSPRRGPRYCRISRATSIISSSLLSCAPTPATITATPQPRAAIDVPETPPMEELEENSLLLCSLPAMTAYRTPQRATSTTRISRPCPLARLS